MCIRKVLRPASWFKVFRTFPQPHTKCSVDTQYPHYAAYFSPPTQCYHSLLPMKPYKQKIQPKSSTSSLCCALPSVHFPNFYCSRSLRKCGYCTRTWRALHFVILSVSAASSTLSPHNFFLLSAGLIKVVNRDNVAVIVQFLSQLKGLESYCVTSGVFARWFAISSQRLECGCNRSAPY